jgi:hypothetical protein
VEDNVMNIPKIFSILILLLIFMAVSDVIRTQERWVFIDSFNDSFGRATDNYYDNESILYSEEGTEVWVKSIYTNYIPDEYGRIGEYAMTRVKYYCNKRITKITEMRIYYFDGSNENINPNLFKDTTVEPESRNEKLFQLFCD